MLYNRMNYVSDKQIKHSTYYRQFVNDFIKKIVLSRFSIETLVSAFKTDPCFNNIPLKQWDNLTTRIEHSATFRNKLKEAGDYYTLAGAVCVLKEAAKMLVEEHNNESKKL